MGSKAEQRLSNTASSVFVLFLFIYLLSCKKLKLFLNDTARYHLPPSRHQALGVAEAHYASARIQLKEGTQPNHSEIPDIT